MDHAPPADPPDPPESLSLQRLGSAVARDVNHLFAAIGSTVELVRRLADDERIARLVDAAEISVRRGERLVGQLLAFAREQKLRPVPVDLHALLAAPEAPWRRAGPDEAAIRIVVGTGAAHALLDPACLHAALGALVSNARDALVSDARGAAAGEVTVSVATRGDRVAIVVADRGCGMAQAVATRATEPFFTTKGEGSTGLGLSVVQGFVAQSGGRLAISTAPGEGTEVRLDFPALPAEARSPIAPAIRASILVVEDDEMVRSLLVEMLEAHHFAVDTAENGTVALAKLDRVGGYDVLFTDIVMPDGPNGVELARRAQERDADLRVLLASGYTRNHLRAVEGLKDGMRFLPKPYRMTQMIAALEALLESA